MFGLSTNSLKVLLNFVSFQVPGESGSDWLEEDQHGDDLGLRNAAELKGCEKRQQDDQNDIPNERAGPNDNNSGDVIPTEYHAIII